MMTKTLAEQPPAEPRARFAQNPSRILTKGSKKTWLTAVRRSLVALASCLGAASAQANLPQLEILDQLNTPALAPEVITSDLNAQERLWFVHAEKALRQGRRLEYQQLKQRLVDYPLHPYLELKELQARFHVAKEAEVVDLLQTHANVPLASILEIQWLHELSRRGDWQGLLEHMPSPAPSDTLRCLDLRAKLETGDKKTLGVAMPSLWLTGASLPDACDPVIDAWRQQGGLSHDLAWQRAALAIKGNNPGLAKWLKRYLPPELDSATDRLLLIHRSPQRLENTEAFAAGLPRTTEIVAHGMVQYSRREPEKAAALWPHYRDALPFTPAQRSSVNSSLGLMLAVRYLPQAQALLAEANSIDADPNLYEWQARVHLRKGDWEALTETINGFPDALRETARWQYWLARAEEARGAHDDAQARYALAAGERNFYGFMAADRLGVPYRLNHQAHPISKDKLAQIQSMPAVKRTYELFRMGRLSEARAEWRGLLHRLDHDQVLVASQLAQSWGWHEQGVMGAIFAQAWDDLQMRFPLAHQELFTNHATLRKLDVNWVYALARQESAFMADARSSAGALGLLQLMPGTAKQTAREIGIPFKSSQQLLEPAENIQLGTAHLADLLDRFGNNRILATAAYNAGAHRVAQWLKDGGDKLDADVWIETMPYYETRQYVQNVLAYTVIYGFRRGEPPAHLLTARELACFCTPTDQR